MHHDAQKLSPVDGDLTEMMFIDATIQGKMMPSEAIIVAGPYNYPDAIELSTKYHARAVLVPEEFLNKADHWLVIGPNGSVWSPGA